MSGALDIILEMTGRGERLVDVAHALNDQGRVAPNAKRV
jgi:hypothetical protein